MKTVIATTTQDKILNFVQEQRKPLLAVTAVLGLALAGWTVYKELADRKEFKAHEALFSVNKKYQEIKESFSEEPIMPGLPAKTTPPKKSSGDLKADYGQVPEEFERLLAEHAGTQAAAEGALIAAGLLLDYKQTARAQTLLEKAVASTRQTSMNFAFLNAMLGTTLAVKEDCAGAILAWQRVLSLEQFKYMFPDLLLKKAACHESLKQSDQARDAYKRLTNEFATSAAGQKAKILLRLLGA